MVELITNLHEPPAFVGIKHDPVPEQPVLEQLDLELQESDMGVPPRGPHPL